MMIKKILLLSAALVFFSGKNAAGCSVSISVSPNDTVCTGTSVTFTPAVLVTCTTHYIDWFVNGILVMSASSSTPVPFTLNNPQNGDSVSCQVACNPFDICYSNAIVMTVTQTVTPSVTIIAIPDTICYPGCITFIATPVNGGSSPLFQWYEFSTGPVPGATAITWTQCTWGPGTYSVYFTLTSSDVCANPGQATSNTVNVLVQVCTDVEEKIPGSSLTISNPGEGFFTIYVRSFSNNSYLTATNALGEMLWKQKVISENTEINLSNHPAGIYFVSLRDEKNNLVTEKIVKMAR
ncbi:MAG TPA: T9SS type A sorting domain-containing protein [Bacteroidia bacterium]|nr:T9SS type A sorting domain-containing protein [Bacteroidia bacterium]